MGIINKIWNGAWNVLADLVGGPEDAAMANSPAACGPQRRMMQGADQEAEYDRKTREASKAREGYTCRHRH